MFPLLYIFNDWALVFLRFVLGGLLAAHGWPKLKDLKTTGSNFDAMGFKPGGFWGTIAALVEFFGGLALIVGLYAQPVAFLVAVQFVVITIWKLIRRKPLVGGWEFDVLILAAALILAVQGAGVFSLDWYLLGVF